MLTHLILQKRGELDREDIIFPIAEEKTKSPEPFQIKED